MPSCHDHLPPVDLTRVSAASILSGEHRVILQVLSCLELMAERARREERIPEPHAAQALEVLRTFADTCHHGKEESILFPALEAQVPEFGPTRVMRAEHVDGRIHIKAMGAALASGQPTTFAEHAEAYVALLRQHIHKEDEILFRIAQHLLTPEQDAELVEAYRRVEHDDVGSGEHERLLGIADALAQAYGVPIASRDPVIFALLTAVCGCHSAKAH